MYTTKTSREEEYGLRRLRALPPKERVPRFPRRATPLQDILLSGVVYRKFHASEFKVKLSRQHHVSTSTTFSASSPHARMYCGGSNTETDRKPTFFAQCLEFLVQAVKSGLFPLHDGTAVGLTASLDGGIPYPISNSPPGYVPHSTATFC